MRRERGPLRVGSSTSELSSAQLSSPGNNSPPFSFASLRFFLARCIGRSSLLLLAQLVPRKTFMRRSAGRNIGIAKGGECGVWRPLRGFWRGVEGCEAPGRAGDPCKGATHWRGTDRRGWLGSAVRRASFAVPFSGYAPARHPRGALSRVCVIVPKQSREALRALYTIDDAKYFHTS